MCPNNGWSADSVTGMILFGAFGIGLAGVMIYWAKQGFPKFWRG